MKGSSLRRAFRAHPGTAVGDDGTVYGACKACGGIADLSPEDRIQCPAGCSHEASAAKLLRWFEGFQQECGRAPAANGPARPAGRGGSATPKRSKLRRLDVAQMIRDDPPAVPWVIEGLVVRGMLTVVNGRGGEGKSLLAMALAAGVATGQDDAGLRCHAGRVAIVDAENGEGEIHRRVRTLELPSEGVEVFEAEGFDLRSDLGELGAILEAHRPDLLVLDSYRSLWGGEENDSREVSAVLDPLRNLVRRHDAGTLLLHHSGRVNGAYRGSSAIGASAELGVKLARLDDDPDPTRRYLEAWKCRPAERPAKRWLRLSVERGRVFIDAAEPPEEEKPAKPAPVREELRPRVLDALSVEPRSRSDIARAAGRTPTDRSIGRVLEELLEAGEAEKTEGGWRRLAVGTPPIGTCQPANPPATPHSRAENRVGTPPATFEGVANPREAEVERIGAKFGEPGEAS